MLFLQKVSFLVPIFSSKVYRTQFFKDGDHSSILLHLSITSIFSGFYNATKFLLRSRSKFLNFQLPPPVHFCSSFSTAP